jgi:hypothetical protein
VSQHGFDWCRHEWVSLASFYCSPDIHTIEELELQSISSDYEEIPGRQQHSR